ncbi:MAG: accessory gene regulator B family protein [Ruminococcus flavefaciens]|nr:accessory gene regulator B family protein [Roseburia sp.]MCM1234458.1 accessory gene regulator B family protein [Ruminococcus flavefaciens]
MIEKMAFKLVNQMEMEKIISKSSCEYYEYAVISMTEHAITVGTMLLLGLIFKQFLHTICFMVFFFSLRRRTGGFHADKFCQCYLGTVITYIVLMQVVPALCINQTIMYGMLFGAIVLICIMGTINHPNVDMNKSELQESKKAARLVVLMEVMVIAVLAYLKADILYIGYMTAAVILCAFLMCLAKIIKQEVCVK